MGSGRVCCPGREMLTVAGDLLLLPPKLARHYRVDDRKAGWGFYFLHFCPTELAQKSLDWFQDREPKRLPVNNPTVRNRIVATLEEMHQINLRTPEIEHRVALLNSLADSVLLRVASLPPGDRTAGGGVDLRIERVLERVHGSLDRPHRVDELAGVAGLSRSQFCLLFRAGTGRSPQEYLEERRLELARSYLVTSVHSIAEIAARLGYSDPFYFSARFKRRYKQSPSAARKAGASGHRS
jgi:AraC family transcriptional regulator of arabinose operon